MSDTSSEDSPTIFYRVYSRPDGHAFLLYEPGKHQVEIQLPITQGALEGARKKLREEGHVFQKKAKEGFTGTETFTSLQQKANLQIKRALEPEKRSRFAAFMSYLEQMAKAAFAIIVIIAIFYGGVEFSYTHLPEIGHIVVLGLYVVGLALCLSMMFTDETRRKETWNIRVWFGPWGMIVLPGLVLFSAAAVFGSGTFLLHKHGLVVLKECAGRAVAPGAVTDFYMWHFLKLFPLVNVNEVLKLSVPLCYEQKRVGFLILLFQALVVLPAINTVMYYWKHRQVLSAPSEGYIFDPEWQPDEDQTKAIDANRKIVDSAKL